MLLIINILCDLWICVIILYLHGILVIGKKGVLMDPNQNHL